MASEDVTVKRWTCDACGKKTTGEAKDKALPPGWTHQDIPIKSGIVDLIKRTDVCQECSKDPEMAKRHAKERSGQ